MPSRADQRHRSAHASARTNARRQSHDRYASQTHNRRTCRTCLRNRNFPETAVTTRYRSSTIRDMPKYAELRRDIAEIPNGSSGVQNDRYMSHSPYAILPNLPSTRILLSTGPILSRHSFLKPVRFEISPVQFDGFNNSV
jgi:hypothetical protein